MRLVRDLLPFDVVKVAFEFAESFYLEHAAEDARQLRGHENLALVLRVVNIHRLFLSVRLQWDETVSSTTGHVIPLRE